MKSASLEKRTLAKDVLEGGEWWQNKWDLHFTSKLGRRSKICKAPRKSCGEGVRIVEPLTNEAKLRDDMEGDLKWKKTAVSPQSQCHDVLPFCTWVYSQ